MRRRKLVTNATLLAAEDDEERVPGDDDAEIDPVTPEPEVVVVERLAGALVK